MPKDKLTKQCERCNKIFLPKKNKIIYCSKICANRANWIIKRKNPIIMDIMRKNGHNVGILKTPEDKHPRWKGDLVGYDALHSWVNKHLGKADHCEDCKLDKKLYHWANISGKYKRILTDWKSLCVKCHSKYDHNR